MSLTPGSRLGQYEITARIGAGGMGEVYSACDVRLGRDVALKILHEPPGSAPDRRDRFDREARALAALNHPNIAQIYGIVEAPASDAAAGTRAIVMELVPGQTLAERIAAGPLPATEALEIARQIADGLAAAHDRQIVHRDLKPANVKILPGGGIKILDFGLAKALEPAPAERGDGAMETETGTAIGVLLGTPAYMSPEQTRGAIVDRRTDIWAFGCLLFELLTSRRAFDRATATDTLAAVIERDPDWTALPASTPDRVHDLLRRCLDKDPRKRARDAADLALEIDQILAGPQVGIADRSRRPARRVLPVLAGAAVLAVAGAITAAYFSSRERARPGPAAPSHVSVVLPTGDRVVVRGCPMFALSPDGRQLAYIGLHDGRSQIFVRSLDAPVPRAIEGTEDVTDTLFFSPDGNWIGFITGTELKKIPVAGGSPATVATTRGCGADWNDDGRIIVGRLEGVYEMPRDAGGATTRLIPVDAAKREQSLLYPSFLPGGQTILATLATRSGVQIIAQRLDTGERRVLIENGTQARYLADGRVVYGSGSRILSVPFDPRTLQVTGPSVPIAEGVVNGASSGPFFAVARSTGAIAYLPGGQLETLVAPVWVDRSGTVAPLPIATGRYSNARLSPDGRRLALVAIETGVADVLVFDIERGSSIRLTDGGLNGAPVWSPDGTKIAYISLAEEALVPVTRPADGSGRPERLFASAAQLLFAPTSWTRRAIAFTRLAESSGNRAFVLEFGRDQTPRELVQTSAATSAARFSPDGQWFVHVSNESGRPEVHLRPFDRAGGVLQVSVGGGADPLWGPGGREIFYRSGDRVMAVTMSPGDPPTLGTPRQLFEGRFMRGDASWDIAADGRRFLMLQPGPPPPAITTINLITGWR